MAYLLDVNVLIALMDGGHVHHEAAHAWFGEKASVEGWMTCPIVENGVVRILSHPAYPSGPLPVTDLLERLEEFKANATGYRFCPESASLTDRTAFSRKRLTSSNLTDAYLLRVAVEAEGKLATLDRRIIPDLIGLKDRSVVEQIPA